MRGRMLLMGLAPRGLDAGLGAALSCKHFLDLGILAVGSSLAFSIRGTVFIQDYMIIH